MMPVRYEDLTSDLELPARFDIYDYMEGIEEMLSPSQLPSEDIWKKFDLLDMNYPTFLDEHFDFETMHLEDLELGSSTPAPAAGLESKKQQFYSCCGGKYDREIRHHDCMWAGYCSSNDHGSKYTANAQVKTEPVTDVMTRAPSVSAASITAAAAADDFVLRATIKHIKEEPQEPPEEPLKIKTEPVYDLVNSVKSEANCESVSVSNATDVPNTKVVSITTNVRTQSSNVAEEVVPKRRYIVQRTPSRSLVKKCNESSPSSSSSSLALSSPTKATITLPTSRVMSESVKSSSCVTIVKSSSPEKSWSSRPETPQSLPESDDESTPIAFNNAGQALFKSAVDSIISANPQLPNYAVDTWDSEDSSAALASWPVSEVTGQVRRTSLSKMIERSVSVTDSDHNYGMKINTAKYASPIKMEDLGVQTPSDSEEEEVDVVSFNDTSSIRSSSRSSSVSRELMMPMPADEEEEDDDDDESSNDLSESCEKVTTYYTKSQRGVKRKRRQSFSYDDNYIDETKSQRASQSRKRARASRSKASAASKCSPTKSRFGSTDSESEHFTSDRRSFHNSMERKRRVDLRNSFEELRCLVPRIEHKKRSPKVVILNEAALFCMELSTSSQKMNSELAALRRQQEGLRAAVSMLRKSLAASR